MEICPKCGLPKEACICETLAKEQEKIVVRKEKRKFGKIVTVVNFNNKINLKEIAKELKKKLACGGTVKDNEIELQGDHAAKIKEKLVELGFNAENIEIVE